MPILSTNIINVTRKLGELRNNIVKIKKIHEFSNIIAPEATPQAPNIINVATWEDSSLVQYEIEWTWDGSGGFDLTGSLVIVGGYDGLGGFNPNDYTTAQVLETISPADSSQTIFSEPTDWDPANVEGLNVYFWMYYKRENPLLIGPVSNRHSHVFIIT